MVLFYLNGCAIFVMSVLLVLVRFFITFYYSDGFLIVFLNKGAQIMGGLYLIFI